MSAGVATKSAKTPKGTKSGPQRGGAAGVVKSADVLSIGGAPRVHLLPPEVLARKNGRRLRRRLGVGLIGAVVLVAAGMGLATVALLASQHSLTDAQKQSTDLSSEQAKYSAVTKLQLDSAAIKVSQGTATAQEIAWRPYVADLQKTLTSGMAITAIDASLDDPNSGAAAVPLQGPRIATMKVTVTSPQSSISDWLVSLQTLTGFVDETPGSVTLVDGEYKVNVVLHINSDALENRYATKK
jgi:hypothetical protein